MTIHSSVDGKNRDPGRAKITVIFMTILLDALGLGILIPVFPEVLRRFNSDPSVVSQNFGYFIGSYALMQFLASPVLGALSDRFGRKPILLGSLFGSGVDYLFMAFAPSLPLLFLGRVISGLTGASVSVATSYVVDVSQDHERAKNFGLIGAAWGVGFIAGPVIGGMLGSFDEKLPFLFAAGLNLVNFTAGIFVLPESLPTHLRRRVSLNALNPFSLVIKILKPSPYLRLVWIYFFIFLAGQVHPVNWTLYTQTKFGWSAWQVGMSLSFVGVVIAFSQAVLTRVVIPRWGEEKSLSVALMVNSLSFVLYGIATQGWMIYVIMVVSALAGLATPALQTIIARHIPANRQGELQGSLVALSSVASVVAPWLYTELFVAFTRPQAPVFFPGIAYVTAGGICLMTFLIWLSGRRRSS